MKLTDILNYKTDPGQPRTLRRNALRWLAGFFALMLACTVLSRAADSLTVAQVDTAAPERASILHEVSADGRLSASRETAVTALTGVPVQSVETHQGASVKAGDPLFTLDPGALEEQLYKERLELQKLNIQLEKARDDLGKSDERKSTAAARAQEDFDFAVNAYRNRLAQAGEDRRRARDDLREYVYDNDVDEDSDEADDDPAYVSLKRAYRSAQRAYEDLEKGQTEEMVKAERAIEDAELESSDTSAATLAIDCQLKQLEISRMQTALAAGGVVAAPADAIVTGVALSVGKLTTQEAAVLLSGAESGLRFSGEITKEQARRISAGDDMEIALSGGKTDSVKTKVESLNAIEDKSGYFELAAAIPAGKGGLGMSATAKITQKTQNYPACVPLTAVRSDGPQKYVLVVRELQTVLGTELSAERVNVTVTDQNGTRAAVDGALSPDDKIITASSRAIGAGDRVRLRDA